MFFHFSRRREISRARKKHRNSQVLSIAIVRRHPQVQRLVQSQVGFVVTPGVFDSLLRGLLLFKLADQLQVDGPLKEPLVRVVLEHVVDSLLRRVERGHVRRDHGQVRHLP